MIRPAAAVLCLLISAAAPANDTDDLIGWLFADGRELRGIPFPEVVRAATGKTVVPVDREAAWLGPLGQALDRTLAALNAADHPIHSSGRINEASRFIEDQLLRELNAVPGWECTIPTAETGAAQRSGYPDLRLALPDGTVVYLDPKLYAEDSRTSSLRTFYYEPKTATNKIQDDACHVLVGIAHAGGSNSQSLHLTGWELVDVSKLRVQLKAEFQAANRDLYREDLLIRRSSEN